jgi:hypothetical protein
MKRLALSLLLSACAMPLLRAQTSAHLNVPVSQHVTVSFAGQAGLPTPGAMVPFAAYFPDGTKWDLTQGIPAGYTLVLLDVQIVAKRPAGEPRTDERLFQFASGSYDRVSGEIVVQRSFPGAIPANRWEAAIELQQTAGQSYTGHLVPILYSNYLEPDETAAPMFVRAFGYVVRTPRIILR